MAKVGKFELVRKLATGGMAEVFLAKAEWARGVERTVVVKRILSHLAEDPNFVDMFLSEAKLAAQLSHPNIVQIFEFGETEGVYFLAMEYVDGPNLRTLGVRAHELGRPIDFRICAKLISSSCEALSYAHDLVDPNTGVPLQLVHRDISPDNIILSKNGSVKVVDFGIAKAATQHHHTKTGLIKGKLAYMAPEQLKTKQIDRRADVYALGVVLYELVAGAKPYDAESEVTMMHAVLYEPMVPIRQRRPDVPEGLEAVINRALAHDREERYPDCREFHRDLERFIMSSGDDPVGTFEIAKLISELQAQPTGGPASQVMGVATPSKMRGSVTPGPERRESTPPQPAGVAEPAALKATGSDGDQAPILLTGNLIASALLGTPEAQGQKQAPVARARKDAAHDRPADRADTEMEMPALQIPPEPNTEPGAPKAPPRRETKSASPATPAAPLRAKTKAREQVREAREKEPAREKERAAEAAAPAKPRSKMPLIAAGAGLVVVLAAVGIVLMPKGDPDKQLPQNPPVADPPQTHTQTQTQTPETGTGKDTQTQPQTTGTQVAAATTTEPDKDPGTGTGTEQKDPPQTPGTDAKDAKDAKDSPAAEGVLVTLKSEPAARIRVLSGKRARGTGKSPYSLRLGAGTYDVEVFDEAQGLFKRDKITVRSGQDHVRETFEVKKGALLISSFPWANVSVNGKALGATPQRAEVYEGTHTVTFDCSNGKKDKQTVELTAGSDKRVKGKCE